jgi:four helix bundle protein
MHNYKELKVWQKAMENAKKVFQVTALFPSSEKYGLVSQMNKCAVSIPSNIAEGAGRSSQKEFVQFLSIATGSAYELETQIMLAQSFEFINKEMHDDLILSTTELQRMLYKLRSTIKESLNTFYLILFT